MHTTEAEKAKYERMWGFGSYRKNAPGEKLVADAINRLGIDEPTTVIDFGCGTGRAARAFKKRGHIVTGIDIAENCLDPGVNILLVNQCLWEPIGIKAEIGYCTDVMEHIPPEHVDAVLANIAACTERSYFQIATRKDAMGRLIKDTLHLTVKPADWWEQKLSEHFERVEAYPSNGAVIACCS